MPANSEKEHLSIVICGHVDGGKSTSTGRLIFELGGLSERELEKLKAEAGRLGKASFAFAFCMERLNEERERGVTIACFTKEFHTDRWRYTIIDAPGHRDFIKKVAFLRDAPVVSATEYAQRQYAYMSPDERKERVRRSRAQNARDLLGDVGSNLSRTGEIALACPGA